VTHRNGRVDIEVGHRINGPHRAKVKGRANERSRAGQVTKAGEMYGCWRLRG